MQLAEKVALGIIGIAFATTLLLPDRQTVQALDAGRRFFTDSLRTAMGR